MTKKPTYEELEKKVRKLDKRNPNSNGQRMPYGKAKSAIGRFSALPRLEFTKWIFVPGS